MKVQFLDDGNNIISSQNLKEKVFSSGSCGYNGHGKIELDNGERLQISLNLIAVGSKEWDDDEKRDFFEGNK